MANLDNYIDATYLPTTALVFGEMGLVPLSQAGNLDIYPENIESTISIQPENIESTISIQPENTVSYMCAFSPTVKELNSMLYVFGNNVITIDGAYFGNITLIN